MEREALASEFGKPIHHLPLIPATVLKKHRVHEPAVPRGVLALSVRLGPVGERRIFRSATASDADAAHSFSIHYRERLI